MDIENCPFLRQSVIFVLIGYCCMSSGDEMRPDSIDKGYLIDEKNAALRERLSLCAITEKSVAIIRHNVNDQQG